MEKDYAKRVMEIKRDIFSEISDVLKCSDENDRVRFDFKDTFYIHYEDGPCAATDVCHAVEGFNSGSIVFYVSKDESAKGEDAEAINGTMVFCYTVNSLIDVLERLKKELREEKVSRLREIIRKNGDSIFFLKTKKFWKQEDAHKIREVTLTDVSLEGDRVCIGYLQDDFKFDSDTEICDLETLDMIANFAEKETFALTDEQNDAIDEALAAFDKLRELNITTLWDFESDMMGFLNSKGLEVSIEHSGFSGNNAIDVSDFVSRKTSMGDFVYGESSDAVCVNV